jgi:hypothetical protein
LIGHLKATVDPCYITGKHLPERTPADYSQQVEECAVNFSLRDIFERLNAIDSMPISLAKALQVLGKHGEYIEISGSGQNALDFHIAYYWHLQGKNKVSYKLPQ